MQITADWATRHGIVTYTRHNHQGVLRHLVIREGKNTGERMVTLFSTSDVTHVDELAEDLKNSGIPITTFLWAPNDDLSDVAKGAAQKIYWGEGRIHEKVGDVLIRVPQTSFMQTNTHASEKMVQLLQSWSEETGWQLIDLYCGSGVLGLNLAQYFFRVIGVEMDKAAIDEARINAKANGIVNAEFTAGRAEEEVSRIVNNQEMQQTTVVVDPPRAGLHKKVVEALLSWEAPNIYYVSCNPASLARDLRQLRSKYRIKTIQPMDFFPHTDHVETAVQLVG